MATNAGTDKKGAVADEHSTAAGATDPDDVAWIPLDPETDCGEHGLTPLLHHRLGHKVSGEITFAQLLAQKLIQSALDGNARSLEEIFVRIDGDAKSREPAAKSLKAAIDIDETTAVRILDAFHDERDCLAGN